MISSLYNTLIGAVYHNLYMVILGYVVDHEYFEDKQFHELNNLKEIKEELINLREKLSKKERTREIIDVLGVINDTLLQIELKQLITSEKMNLYKEILNRNNIKIIDGNKPVPF